MDKGKTWISCQAEYTVNNKLHLYQLQYQSDVGCTLMPVPWGNLRNNHNDEKKNTVCIMLGNIIFVSKDTKAHKGDPGRMNL